MSRTEEVVDALCAAVEARARVREIEAKYARTPLEAYGESPLAVAVAPARERYVRALDALRGHLAAAGLSL